MFDLILWTNFMISVLFCGIIYAEHSDDFMSDCKVITGAFKNGILGDTL